jgi:hypothetical protein
MIADIIVGASALFAAAFSLAWLLRRDLRTWIEEPKFRFQQSVQRYDRGRADGGRFEESGDQ